VTNSTTGFTGFSANSFTVTALPVVTSFTPTSGAVGTSVTITGTNFDNTPGNTTVKFNGVFAPLTSNTATTIIVPVPPTATTGPISVSVGSLTGISANNFTVTVTTGDLHPSSAGMLIYPNPSSDEITVDLGCFEKGKEVDVTIVDLGGQLLDKRLATGGGTITLDVRHLPSGNFILKAAQQKMSYSRQFVKQ